MAKIKIHQAQEGDILIRNVGPGRSQRVYVDQRGPQEPVWRSATAQAPADHGLLGGCREGVSPWSG